jgi:tetratricopeptide (TPR) repeat protein
VAAPPIATLESSNEELRDALAMLRNDATPTSHLRVAEAYRRAGVLDFALDHYDAALKNDPRLAAAYDGRARIWRDWGLVGLGVGDAARAIYFAPRSPAARNTLGTLLMALGDCAGAREAFLQAQALDSNAAYVERNLETVNRAFVQGAAACRPATAR